MTWSSVILLLLLFYFPPIPGFSGIGRTREGPRFSITFALYVKKIFISRVCKCVTRNVFTMCRKIIYPSVCEDWRRLNLSKNPRYTFFTIKSSIRSHIKKVPGYYFIYLILECIMFILQLTMAPCIFILECIYIVYITADNGSMHFILECIIFILQLTMVPCIFGIGRQDITSKGYKHLHNPDL